MTVRPATEADLPALHAIAAANPTAPQWTPDQFADALRSDPGSAVMRVALVADHLGSVAGFAIASALTRVFPVEAELESIVVAPGLHGQGIGRELLRYVVIWCREHHVSILRLEVRVSNAPAIALYRRTGFQERGIRRLYYTDPAEDAVCMHAEFL